MVTVSNAVKNLGQYFTPKFLAEWMVKLISPGGKHRILEPSAGTGVFMEALELHHSDLVAIELDNSLVSNAKTPFLYLNFFDYPISEKFSIVIGNPPYVRWRNQDQNIRDDIIKRNFWNNRLNALADILQAFIFKSIDHLENNGELIFLTPKFWLQTLHASTLRQFILDHGYIDLLIDCNEKSIFPSVSSNLVIFKFIKAKLPQNHQVKVFTFLEKDAITDQELEFITLSLAGLQEGHSIQHSKSVSFHHSTHPITNQSWIFIPEKEKEFLETLEKSCTTGYTVEVILRSDLIAKRSELLLTDCFPKKWLESLTIDTKKFQIAYLGTKKYFFSLKNHFQNNQQPLRRFVTIGDLFEIGNGMVSGLDKAFWIDNQLDSNQTITKLNAIERSLLRRVIKARFMQQYTVSKYTNYIFIEENQFESEKDFQRQCPTLYSILQPYKEDLLSRWVPKPTSWYIWSFPRNYEIFLSFKNKFYLPCKERFDNKGFIRCVLDQTNALGVQDITVLGLHTWVKESPEYLLAYLNSDILFKWLLQKGLKRGGVFQFSEHPLVTIPVRLINWESENEIAIHEKISKLVLLLLKSSSDSEKKEWKKKIDDLLQRLIFE